MNTQNILKAAQQKIWNISVKLEMLREHDQTIDTYSRRVNALHRRLHIPRDYTSRGLPFQRKPTELVAVTCGLNGQTRYMTPETKSKFLAMQTAAAAFSITLVVRWGYRSIDDQAELIREQLACSSSSIDQLLTWIAAPGHSEHHTGRALDFECIPADMAFEDTGAFGWLNQNAKAFGFQMSYPPLNPYGIIPEPWHWCYHPEA